jgi:hypothetical protein
MLRSRSRRRRGEEGQVLVMALAFIALFAAASVAVLNYASRTQSQKQHSEVTAQTDSLAEGGAIFALADSNRGDSSCASGNSGILTMQSNDKVQYSTVNCASATSGSSSLAASCTLCLLGTADNTLSAAKAPMAVTGTVAINGGVSLSNGSPLTSTAVGTTPGFIGLVKPSTCATSGPDKCTPNAVAISAISDPLQSSLPPPTGAGAPQSIKVTGGTTTLSPGVYTALDVSGGGTISLRSGVYVITGPVSSSGSGSIVSDSSDPDPNKRGVLIYLTCADNQGRPRSCNTGESGASVSLSGNGAFSVNSLPPGSGSPYAGVVLYSDRNNTSQISLQGNGNSLSGTVYAKSGSLHIGGNGSASITGRLLATSVDIQVSGQVGTGFSLTGVAGGLNVCSLSDVNVSGTSGSTTSSGRAVLQAACSGGSAIASFTYGGTAVNKAPAITSASSTAFTAGSAGSFQATATGFPTPAFSQAGNLPSGVTLSSSGLLSGTPAAGTGGTYPLTITAANGVSPNATQSFTLTVNQAPAITSASAATFTTGSAGSFQATATGLPAPTFSETGNLPSGATLSSSGLLSGTPTAGTGGTYPLTITATNAVGSSAPQSFTLTVNQAPAITSGTTATFTVGSAGSFQATPSGFPAPTFTETGALPTGVTLNPSGLLAGTPGAGMGGTYLLTIIATNGVGSNATQSFTLTVNQPLAITSITSSNHAGGTPGKAEVGDTFSVAFNNALQPSTVATGSQTMTLCSKNACSPNVSNTQTNIVIGGLTAAAGFTVDTNYVSGGGSGSSATASGTLSLSSDHKTVTFTITSISGTMTTGTAKTFTFSPLATIKDTNGSGASSFNQTTATRLF